MGVITRGQKAAGGTQTWEQEGEAEGCLSGEEDRERVWLDHSWEGRSGWWWGPARGQRWHIGEGWEM